MAKSFLSAFRRTCAVSDGVLSAYGDQLVAVILYAATLAIIGLLLSLLWFYASHNHRLVAKMLTAHHIHVTTLRNAVAPLVFLASIGIALVSIPAAEATWVLVFAINAVLVPRIINIAI